VIVIDRTLRALEAGKHVLCEKPFSRRADEVEQAYDRAESAGLVVSEGFMWRHHPQTARLVDAVGQAGTIEAVYRSVEVSTPIPLTDWSSA
jgi:D-xylose 1-dehydrogenase (NADP+, D-xylono-1,5-lactone-forming)